jgi:hypothetical protein
VNLVVRTPGVQASRPHLELHQALTLDVPELGQLAPECLHSRGTMTRSASQNLGAVVVQSENTADSRYAVWHVEVDGEHRSHPLAYVFCAIGALPAIALARLM